MHLDTQITDTQEISVSGQLLDKKGKVISVLPSGFSLQFVSSDINIATVNPLPDGFSAEIVAVDVGTCTITVSASDPAIPASDVGVTVTNSAPGSLLISLGDPQEQS